MKNILIYGAGYVGLSNGLLLARKNNVTIADINKEIISDLKINKIHIDDDGCRQEIINSNANFELNQNIKINNYDYIFLALPTNYDENNNKFDTSCLDNQIKEINELNFKGTVIIKSTIPIGYTKNQNQKNNIKIVFCPEFLREGSSFNDAKNPSRIIVGSKNSHDVANLFLEVSENKPECLMTSSTEAEAIKLFANTYLAMRIAFVNELDTFAKINHLDSQDIINGIALDPRIGKHYFKPSYGYGGYCLPKDSKQLQFEFNDKKVPSKLFDAIVKSNEMRMDFIAEDIATNTNEFVINGISHKPGVKNFRNSPKLEVAKRLRKKGVKVVIKDNNFLGKNIDGFKIEEE